MRNWVARVYIVLVAVCLSGQAIAQECDAILRGGAFNESVSNVTYDSRDVVMRFACNSSSVRSGAGASAVIDGVPMSGNQYRDKIKSSCDQYNQDRTVSTTDFQFVRDASAVIAQAWSACMSQPGTKIGLQQSPDYKRFLVTTSYRRPGSRSPNQSRGTISLVGDGSKCECVSSSGGSCAPFRGGFQLRVPDAGSRSINCTRKSATGVLFSLNSDQDGQRNVSLPSLMLSPAIKFSPSGAFSSGGYCSSNDNPIPNLQIQVALYDFETLPQMSVSYHGRSSSLGTQIVDSKVIYEQTNVTMAANRNTNSSGIYLTVGDTVHRILAQYGNYDCSGDIGRRRINNLRISTSVVNLFNSED
jgi:hypothetical protein